jgi:hypothetical protein
MNKNIIIITIGNVIKVGLFVLLAIHFGLWWISLLSMLFLTDYKFIPIRKEDKNEKKSELVYQEETRDT